MKEKEKEKEKESPDRSITVKIPNELWRQLMLMKINGEVHSISDAVVQSIEKFVGKAK